VRAKQIILFLKIYGFKGFVANKLVKKSEQKYRRRPLWMVFEIYERTAAAVSECGLTWHTNEVRRNGDE